MCGLLGAIGTFNMDIFKTAIDSMAHRGPDDMGLYNDEYLALGHRRLSVLDISSAAHQPMISADGRFILIYNGEIYNHMDLRRKIENKYTFHSTGDTETLLYAFIEYGHAVFEMINGIFACAIYDSRKKLLTLARDHFGIKPLYYYADHEKFLFGSELKSINLFPIDRTLDYKALYDYTRFLYAPFNNTPFEQLKKLEAGHYMTLNAKDFKNFEVKQYYDIAYTGHYQVKNLRSGILELDGLLKESVSKQMLSDVPIGFFLSGGLDSSSIVAMARKLRPDDPIDCFTIDTSQYQDNDGFGNDLYYAEKIARRFNCALHVVESNTDIMKSMESMCWSLDEPQTDPASFHVGRISGKARDMGIKVLLSGAGSDEIFSGYRRHQAISFESYIKWIPGYIKKILARNDKYLPAENNLFRRIKKISSSLDLDPNARFFNYLSWMNEELSLQLFNRNIREKIMGHNPYGKFIDILNSIPAELSWLNKILYWETKTYLVNNNLNYFDKMGMSNSVEIRVPFLDIELVHFATSLDPDLKMKGSKTKYLLRKLMESYLPKEVIYRPKTGFGAPVRKWIKEDMKDMVGDLLISKSLEHRGIFDVESVRKIIDQNSKGKIDASYTIWSILNIEIWLKLFLDR